MKKLFIFFNLMLIVCFLTGCFGVSFFAPKEEKSDFYWLPEESQFVDYQIIEDEVRFAYSICFVNESEDDVSVAVSAEFKKSELKDWIEADNFLMGYDESGENMKYEVVKAKEKKKATYYFEGTYKGGNVNTRLSFPEELILTTK